MSNGSTSNERDSDGYAGAETAAEQVKQGTSSLAGLAGGTQDKFAEAAGRVEDRIYSATDASVRGVERAADMARDWRNSADDAVYGVRGFVIDRPVESVALALAAGWVASLLLGKR